MRVPIEAIGKFPHRQIMGSGLADIHMYKSTAPQKGGGWFSKAIKSIGHAAKKVGKVVSDVAKDAAPIVGKIGKDALITAGQSIVQGKTPIEALQAAKRKAIDDAKKEGEKRVKKLVGGGFRSQHGSKRRRLPY